jgi:hypothetical protein
MTLMRISDLHSQMEDLFTKSDTSSIRPSDQLEYTIIGLERLGEHLEEVIAIGDRVHEIASLSQKMLGEAQRLQSELKDAHQYEYDSVVEKLSRSYGHLSWEERGSHYRLKTMDTLSVLRKADYQVIEIEAMCKAIQSKLRVLMHAKDYYMMIVQIMRSSLRLEA